MADSYNSDCQLDYFAASERSPNMLKRLLTHSLFAAALLLLSPLQVLADQVTHPDANVQFYVPDSWSQDHEGEMLFLMSEDETLTMIFWVVESGEVEVALTALETEFKKIMTDFTYNQEDPETTTLNGYQLFYMDGTGKLEGLPAEWEAAVLMADKPLLIMSVALDNAFNRHRADLNKLLGSMRKAK